MGKVKGGLGDASLISDLTRPISFHISEALEPPPVFERRKKTENTAPEKEEHELAEIILKKAASALDEGGNIQVIFYFKEKNEALLIEDVHDDKGGGWRVKAIAGKKGDFETLSWQDSSFSGMDMKDIMSQFCSSIEGIEVISDETLLNFSSIDDFYEWLEI